MTTALQQQTPMPAKATSVGADSPEGSILLKALADHQATTTVRLLDTESQLNSFKSRLPSWTGAEREQGEKSIRFLEGEIRGMKADLDATRQRIQELRGTAPVSSTPAPVAVVGPPPHIQGFNKQDYEGVAGLLILFPIVLAATRWAWRRGSKPSPHNAPIGDARFERLEQAVESIAIEVERISESQRFTTKLLSERQAPVATERTREANRLQRPIITPVP